MGKNKTPLEHRTLAQIKAKAKKKGIRLTSKKTRAPKSKAKLISAIRNLKRKK